MAFIQSEGSCHVEQGYQLQGVNMCRYLCIGSACSFLFCQNPEAGVLEKMVIRGVSREGGTRQQKQRQAARLSQWCLWLCVAVSHQVQLTVLLLPV